MYRSFSFGRYLRKKTESWTSETKTLLPSTWSPTTMFGIFRVSHLRSTFFFPRS